MTNSGNKPAGPSFQITPPMLIGGLLLLSFLARAAYSWYAFTRPGWHFIDDYVNLAVSMLERGEFSLKPGVPSLETTPMYPLFIAFVYFIFGRHPFTLLMFNAILSSATCALTYLTARRLFSNRTAVFSLAISAVYPFSIYYCGSTFRESLMVFLFAFLLWLLVKLYGGPKTGTAASAGIVSAMLSLTNPSSMLFTGAAPLGLLVKGRPAAVARPIILYYAVFAFCLAPWAARNYLVMGRPMLTNIHGGHNLYQALVVPAEDFGTPAEIKILADDPVYTLAQELIAKGRYVEAYDLYMKESRRIILANPKKYLKDSAFRVIKFWRFVPYKRGYEMDYKKIFWASLLSDGIIIPLAAAGLVLFRRKWKDMFPFYIALGLWPLAYYLVYAVIRFRLPVMVIMITLAAAFLDAVLPQRGRGADQPVSRD